MDYPNGIPLTWKIRSTLITETSAQLQVHLCISTSSLQYVGNKAVCMLMACPSGAPYGDCMKCRPLPSTYHIAEGSKTKAEKMAQGNNLAATVLHGRW